MVYGATLRIPGEFFETPPAETGADHQSFLPQLRNMVKDLPTPLPAHHGAVRNFEPPALQTAAYVFVRHDAHRTPLQGPYDGLYKVLERHNKYFVLDMGTWSDSVSKDRLKPAFRDPTQLPDPLIPVQYTPCYHTYASVQ
ncbi:uncharacterized protein LOC131890679 [Tigriopus californicus]|uniref:uncharacterized protein LOC131890679 n=1 Tax=Tigriopus californicus TaxID=6832 RepID=UPI0027D9DAE2|nr:uncharacterized protein LOC131890679 [Tigriopus californicus]